MHATIAFGIDLGNPEYDEWHFESDENYSLPEPWDEDGPDFDELITEFEDYQVPEPNWVVSEYERDSPEWTAARDLWREWNNGRKAAWKSSGFEIGSYGYEYSGNIIFFSESEQEAGYDCISIEPFHTPSMEQIHALSRFVHFLDAKGLVLKDDYRRPRWLLTSAYG